MVGAGLGVVVGGQPGRSDRLLGEDGRQRQAVPMAHQRAAGNLRARACRTPNIPSQERSGRVMYIELHFGEYLFDAKLSQSTLAVHAPLLLPVVGPLDNVDNHHSCAVQADAKRIFDHLHHGSFDADRSSDLHFAGQ